MFATTHLAMGFYLYLMFERLAPIENKVVLFIILMVGSILPDIDHAFSLLGRRIKIISKVFTHRKFIHTIYPMILLSLLVHSIWNNWIYAFAFALTYTFHLFLDGMTKWGVKPFWFGPRIRGFTKTRSSVDYFICGFIIFICVLMIFNVV